jgi:type IV pilus assembly protein PilO
MQELFDRLAATPIAVKLGALLGVVALLCGGYWYFFYDDLTTQEAQTLRRTDELNKEKEEYEKRKREYLAYRNEVAQLLEEQKALLQVLPKTDDIEQFIENIQAQVELAGLTKVSSTREAPIGMDLYTKIPIRMSAVGSYHQINQFFKAVGELKRIVNIEDLSISPSDKVVNGAIQLKANFVATTFQYIEKKGPAAGPAKTSISAGGQ